MNPVSSGLRKSCWPDEFTVKYVGNAFGETDPCYESHGFETTEGDRKEKDTAEHLQVARDLCFLLAKEVDDFLSVSDDQGAKC